jgi:transcriptional regulator with XRE-family HTH domain
MADTFLPADVRTRIIELIKYRKTTQKKVAIAIGISESTFSRFLNGDVEKLGEEYIIRLARVFDVSTDFILGVTEIPDKQHYDISELGLSVEAARNLYTGKVNTDVAKRLLENPHFAMVTHMIEQYLDDTIAKGYVAHNQLITAMNNLTLEHRVPEAVKAVRAANTLKIPPHQADLANIEATFMAAVKEVKREASSDMAAFQELYAKDMKQITAKLTKGQDIVKAKISSQKFADEVTKMVGEAGRIDQEVLDDLNGAIVGLIDNLRRNYYETKRK